MHKTTIPVLINNIPMMVTFKVADVGQDNVIIGLSWLQKHNPKIDWDMGEVQIIKSTKMN